jgi:hypothetical protein
VESEPLNIVMRHMLETKQWCIYRSMPSYLREGVYVVKLDMVNAFESYLDQQRQMLTDMLLAFKNDYPRAVVAAQASLGALFNQDDYPTADEVISRFAIEHAWLTFDVARNIPLEVQQREIVKFQEKLKEAETEILFALREAFADMVEHFVQRLNATRDGGKPPIIKDSLIDNFNEFFNTFSARNIMEDAELSRLVERSKEILRNIQPETLRKSESIRQRTLHAFNDVKKAIDELIKERPVRRFALNEEEEG